MESSTANFSLEDLIEDVSEEDIQIHARVKLWNAPQ